MAATQWHLLYSPRFARSHMIEPGRGMGYVALFSEIGFIFLVTTLVGALAGHWVDIQLGTNPILVVIGLLGGFAIGAVGVARLIQRFLVQYDKKPDPERGDEPRS